MFCRAEEASTPDVIEQQMGKHTGTDAAGRFFGAMSRFVCALRLSI
jgi:hypothetical protein